MIVLDASVALKWLIADEPGRPAALAVLAAIERSPERYAVPELFFNEMLAVLCRRTTESELRLREHLSGIEQLGLTRIHNGHELLGMALHMARAWSVSGYDAVYLATAQLLGGTWLTADGQAAKRVRKPGLVTVLAIL